MPVSKPGPVWIKWGLAASVPATLLTIGLVVWLRSSGESPEVAPPAAIVAAPQPEPPPAEPSEPERQPEAAPPLDTRWLASGAQAVVTLRVAALNASPAMQAVLRRGLPEGWRSLDPMLSALKLQPKEIERLTWSTADLADATFDEWISTGVAALSLAKPAPADWRPPQGEKQDWQIGKSAVWLTSPDWPYLCSLVDDRTIVIGDKSQLKALAERTEQEFSSEPLAEAFGALDTRPHLALAIDLAALRDAGAAPAFNALVEIWRAPRADVKVVRDTPLAMTWRLSLETPLEARLDLVCESETAADQVLGSLDALRTSLEKTVAGEANGLTQRLLDGQLTTASAAQLKLLLAAAGELLRSQVTGREATRVFAVAQWEGDAVQLAMAGAASIPNLEAARLAAARPVDEQHQEQILGGLLGYERAEEGWPAGAAGSPLLPPESRLSWLASLLPYYEHLDWHGDLNFARPWNDVANQRVTRRAWPLVINPALGASATSAGFPVTHYVGVAGLGRDAGQLETSDPRAGMFGFQRRARIGDIGDGASNTIAILGVADRLGPWASGGQATLRALTTRPYFNGPDGFGSGQPDGMLAGMADGSVRFLSSGMDESVLEHLVTINGGEPPPLVARVAPVNPPPQATPAAEDNPPPSDDTPPPAVERPQIDVAARLAETLPGLQLRDVALADAIDLLGQLTAIPLTLDLDSLRLAGVSLDANVTLSLADTSLEQVLTELLEKNGLVWNIAESQLVVTTVAAADNHLAERVYEIDDLTGGDAQQMAALAALIPKLVAPVSWQAAGGAGQLETRDMSLIVKQTPLAQRQVAELLDKLRLARGRPVEGRHRATPEDSQAPKLATRWSLARPVLEASVTCTFTEPTELSQILRQFQTATQPRLFGDWLAMSGVNVFPQTPVTFSAREQPLAEALDALLNPLRLAYRVVDANTLEITSQRSATGRLELEFYPVADLLTDARTPEQLTQQIMAEVESASWSDAGGAAVVHFDPASGYLLILQAQRAQRRIENLLSDLRSPK